MPLARTTGSALLRRMESGGLTLLLVHDIHVEDVAVEAEDFEDIGVGCALWQIADVDGGLVCCYVTVSQLQAGGVMVGTHGVAMLVDVHVETKLFVILQSLQHYVSGASTGRTMMKYLACVEARIKEVKFHKETGSVFSHSHSSRVGCPKSIDTSVLLKDGEGAVDLGLVYCLFISQRDKHHPCCN